MRSLGASLLGKWLLLFTLALTGGSAFASLPVGDDVNPLKLEASKLETALAVDLDPAVSTELIRILNEQGIEDGVFVVDARGRLNFYGVIDDYVNRTRDEFGIKRPSKPPFNPDAHLILPPNLDRAIRNAMIKSNMPGVAITIQSGQVVEFSNVQELAPIRQQEAFLQKYPILKPKGGPEL